MMSAPLQYQIEQFFYRKSELCDAQDWDAYVELFDPQSEFHLPQWDSEHVYTRDPKREMSLIYYANRSGLEDRVFRLRTGKAASATPMPRTLHLINNVRINEQADGTLEVRLNWHTLFYRLATSEQFYGHATYRLKPHGDSWLITRKHALLLNDTINSVLDFYHL
jgi:anthranilate 1,2-dioxygenase (deaminating, decarboxylating) small subunit